MNNHDNIKKSDNPDLKKNNYQITPTVKTELDTHSLIHLLENNSKEKLIDSLKKMSPGISTGYTIGDVEVKFPSGAISIIAAPTSHGKTTTLINFSLGALEQNPEKSVYFFTYEESDDSILILFANTYINKKMLESGIQTALSKNNRNAIKSYFISGTTKYIINNNQDIFITHENNFFDKLINTGKLRVVYSEMTTDELVESIKFIKSNTNVGLICIDYIQILKLSTTKKTSRQEELKDICLKLMHCSIATGLPIVITAQFNRTVVSESDLSSVNIGEAGDIERIASLIIGMFNRNFDKMSRAGNQNHDGLSIKKESSIYFEILKGRGIGNGHSEVMLFDGNAGLIKCRKKPLGLFS